MTVNESPMPEDDDSSSGRAPLELLTDDEESWTAVPSDATGDERVSKWLSIEAAVICDLEEWR